MLLVAENDFSGSIWFLLNQETLFSIAAALEKGRVFGKVMRML